MAILTTNTLVPVLAALGDETRWNILVPFSERDASAATLAGLLPVTRQAIARRLATLQAVGVVEFANRRGELSYRLLGSHIGETVRGLE